MVADDPESFADLDGHECTPMPPVVNSCASKSSNHATQGEGFVELNENSGIPDWYLGEVSAASAEYAAQQQAAQNAQAQNQNQQTLVLTPNRKKDIEYGPYARSEDVEYTVASMDSKGKTTPVKNEAKIELDEKLVGGNPKTRTCNPGECVSKGSLPDTMAVTASGGGHSVEKRFQLDGKPIKVYDATTKKAYDYVRVDASVKKGFVFTFRNDQPQQ